MKIDIFTGATSVRSNNVFTDISRYPTGKHEIIGIYFANTFFAPKDAFPEFLNQFFIQTSSNLSVENAGVAFVKGSNEKNEGFFEK